MFGNFRTAVLAALLMLSGTLTRAQATLSQKPTAAQQKEEQEQKNKVMERPSIHDYKAETLDGGTLDFATLRGKKVLIVNTASECGFTPQYKKLQALYARYQDKLVILGFPSNDFGQQEPGSNKEIHAFCEKNYGVTFPMMAKVPVTGKDMSPVFQFLTDKKKNGFSDAEVKWNFQKFLIDEGGHLVKVLPSKVEPDDPQIKEWLKS